MKVLIVDDELSAREILKSLLERIAPELEIIGLCSDVPSAVDLIKEKQPDVVFLDVEMPEYAGYEIVDFFEEINFKIVFITAYDQYAIKAFELSAVDYLLKPIEINRLKEAIAKLQSIKQLEDYTAQLSSVAKELRKSEKKISYLEKGYRHFIQVDEIIALEAHRAYTQVHLEDDKRIIIAKNLKQLEDELGDQPMFYRTHRSWIINLDYFEKYSKTTLEIGLKNNFTARLSKQFKSDFEARLEEI